MERRLYRSRRERIVAGVAGGLGEYLGLDPVIVRLFFILFALANGSGVLLYAILWVLLPAAPGTELAADGAAGPRTYRRLDARGRNLLVGGTLIGLGVIFLARQLGIWWLDLYRLWPLLLIAAGVALLLDRTRSAP